MWFIILSEFSVVIFLSFISSVFLYRYHIYPLFNKVCDIAEKEPKLLQESDEIVNMRILKMLKKESEDKKFNFSKIVLNYFQSSTETDLYIKKMSSVDIKSGYLYINKFTLKLRESQVNMAYNIFIAKIFAVKSTLISL